MNPIRHPDRSLSSNRSGIAALEFALVSPMAVLLMLVTADLGNFLRLRLDLDSTATVMANTVSQYSELYAGDFATLFAAAQSIAGAARVTGATGCTIMSGIVNSGSGPLVVWQQASSAASFCVSTFGAAGTVPVLPDSYALPANRTLIAVEVYAPGTPWVLSTATMGTSASQLQRGYALFQARTAILASITPGNRP